MPPPKCQIIPSAIDRVTLEYCGKFKYPGNVQPTVCHLLKRIQDVCFPNIFFSSVRLSEYILPGLCLGLQESLFPDPRDLPLCWQTWRGARRLDWIPVKARRNAVLGYHGWLRCSISAVILEGLTASSCTVLILAKCHLDERRALVKIPLQI